MTTIDILSNPLCLQASLGLLDTVRSVPNSAEKIAKDLGLTFDQLPKAIKEGKVVHTLTAANKRNKRKHWKDGRTKYRPVSNEEESNLGNSEKADRPGGSGMGLLREMIKRRAKNMKKAKEYVPKVDDLDLSDSSMCMLHMFPEYAKNSRKYEKMKRKIVSLTLQELTYIYKEDIRDRLEGIFRGSICSRRMQLYKTNIREGGCLALRELRDESVIRPFTQQQIEHVVSLIGQDFPANPALQGPVVPEDVAAVMNMGLALYVPCYVLLPEALMSIFAKVNKLELPMAEEIMKCGAATDEKLPETE